MEQFLQTAIKAYMASNGIVLPDVTLAHVPVQGRPDVALSMILERICGTNPVTSAIFASTRPLVDGLIVEACGPSALAKRLKPVVGSKGAKAVTKALEEMRG